jgi:hypothetical protein
MKVHEKIKFDLFRKKGVHRLCYAIDIQTKKGNKESYIAPFNDRNKFKEFIRAHIKFHLKRADENNFTLIIRSYEPQLDELKEARIKEERNERNLIRKEFYNITGKRLSRVASKKEISSIKIEHVPLIPIYLQKIKNYNESLLK